MCGDLRSPELKCLAASIPHRVMEAKAKSTTTKYASAFYDFKIWTSKYDDIVSFPAKPFSVALYIEYLVQQHCLLSRLEAAYYGINWANNIYGLQSSCVSGLVKHVLEAAKRTLSKPIQKKEPVTSNMILESTQARMRINEI